MNIDWRFKFLYFVAIVAVIVGHVSGGLGILYDWFRPYSYHLLLFVFGSGYFFKESSTENVRKYILHKVKTLIIPFYLWHLFYGIVCVMIKNFGFFTKTNFTFSNLLIDPIMTGHSFIFDMGGWFVIPLFMIQIFNVIVRKLLKISSIHINEYFMFILYLILGLIGVILCNNDLNVGIWLVLDRFLRLLPYYELGILYKDKLEQKDNIPSIWYFSIIFLIQIIFITLNDSKHIELSLSWCGDKYKFILTPYIVSFAGIAFWLRVSNIMLPIIKNNKYIKLVCDNAYSIMINQFTGFMVIKTVWAFISKYTSYCTDFDMEKYRSDIWYYYYPNYHFQIFYIVAGLVIPIVMQMFIDKVKVLIKTKRKG